MKKPLIKYSLKRRAALLGIALWSSHYHSGQGSREYRMGCRAQALLSRSNEIGSFIMSQWWDKLEGYVSGDGPKPSLYDGDFVGQVKAVYQRLAKLS